MKEILDISYTGKDNPRQMLNIYLPEDECTATLLYFHGGGFSIGRKEDAIKIAEYLTKCGIAVVSANYRLKNEVNWPEYINDAACAAAWTVKHIAEYGGSSRIYVGGSSAGGYLSLMLCFDRSYLEPFGIDPCSFAGYVHDSGQPTAHYSVLESEGIDPRRIIVDTTAPLYHIGTDDNYPPMLILVADNDMGNRCEQTQLMVSTLRQFGMPDENICFKILHGTHCQHTLSLDENGNSVAGVIFEEFILSMENRITK